MTVSSLSFEADDIEVRIVLVKIATRFHLIQQNMILVL